MASASSSSSATQWQGYYGGSEQFSVRALRSEAEWDGFWRQVKREKPRALDPAREMGVVVFLGQRNTGGYTVEIASVQPEERKLIVTYREKTPDPDMMVTQALTTPWAVAIVARSDLPIESRKFAGGGQSRREP